ncbi:flagellin N-terminal helical domain-containing protein [Konateibacter massiliensis]|uniref:flagellin N-terminal helical domain-containing protein n=1 Tax=Konateibacter massiliensis TaxID=2002841 RepID=UPI000C14B647|nr:flagellin [Konateibacter massiliensis]
MVVQHNMTAANTNRQLGVTTGALAKSTEKLSSGYRINRAADDAAGLSISEKMRSQIRGLDQASDNAADGISLIQTAEGALNEIHSMLQRMNELAVKAANDTNQSEDRAAIQSEVDQLASEISRIAESTQFNEKDLFTTDSTLSLQVGANSGQSIGLALVDTDATTLSVNALNVTTHDDANDAIDSIQAAIKTVSEQRSDIGALQNRLEYTISNLDSSSENTQAAESRIRDVDMASEMVKYSKNNILMQAGQSMLAQANSQTQGVLSLLQ